MSPCDFWGKPDDVSTGLTLRELDLLIRGRQKRESADYRQLATLAYWLLGAWVKRPPKPEKLMGEKTGTSTDADDFIRKMNEKKKREEKEEVLDFDQVVTLDLVGEAPLDDWYWSEDDKVKVDDG